MISPLIIVKMENNIPDNGIYHVEYIIKSKQH